MGMHGNINNEPLRTGQRKYTDVSGKNWVVYEGIVGRNATRPCLIFESGQMVRRVCDYPENWRTLDDVALERVSWRR